MLDLLHLPDWVPPWLATAALVAGGLFALAFLSMPFAVFGVKARLERIEARLDELHGEIRNLCLRLPDMGLPPIPPAARYDDLNVQMLPPPQLPRGNRRQRMEPKLKDRGLD